MQMAEQFDISTLAWVKGEIDETLKQARLALEAYVDDPNDDAQLQFCITYIHQVYGTLHMVELSGAAMFAEEVETFAKALQQGNIADKGQAYELLMRAILQLPDYLEGLLAGQSDNPAGLVPLLNELRQLRGDKVLDGAAFFRPNLTVTPPARMAKSATGVDSAAAAKKIHRYYLAALAKILKGVDVDTNLNTVTTVLNKLFAIAEGDSWRRFLWVSGSFVEALQDKAIELSRESKPLLGKIEQAIKIVAARGEAGLNEDVLGKLLQPMLYQLARSSASGQQATAVRQAFQLDRYLPQSSGLGGVNAELKQTVSADIMEELSRVKDAFDVYVRSDRRAVSDLEPMAASLSNMAETLSLLQEESLRESLQKQTAVIRQLLAKEVEPSDDILMGIAGSIIAVESALRDWGSASPVVEADARHEQVADAENSPEAVAEHQRVTRQVMKEARDDLIRIREAINAYLENPEDKSSLETLPAMLHMIIGSLSMLSYKRVAQVLASSREFISKELIESDTIPANEALDALADAVMSVEYYLEAFVQSRVHPSSVLDVAENAVATLGYPIGSIVETVTEEETPVEIEGIEVFESGEEEGEDFTPGILAAEDLGDLGSSIEIAEQPIAEEVTPQHEQVQAAETEAVAETVSTVESKPEVKPTAATVEIDDEILEIFIEEAEEEVANIRRLLPQWQSNTGDEEALKDLRRSFHTLKGSGRLVGASELGEFAWAFENMLNRVIDGTIGHNPALFDMLEQALEALPELISQFRDGSVPQADIDMLREMAFDIAEPARMKAAVEQMKSAPVVQPRSEAGEVKPAEEKAAADAPDLDPVLLDIYSKESQGHLDAIDSYISTVKDGGSRKVTEPLIRALHTLQGSSRMAGVVSVAQVCSKLEKYAKTLQATNEVVDDGGIEALESCSQYTRGILAFLSDRENQPYPDNSTPQQLADAAYAAVQHMEDIAHAKPEAGLALKEEAEVVAEALAATELPEQIEAEDVVEEISVEPLAGLEQEMEFAAEPTDEIANIEELSAAAESIDVSGLEEPSAIAVDVEPAQEAAPQANIQMPAGAETRPIEEEYDPELLEIFLEEAVDILDASEETLQAWVDNPEDKSLVQLLQRQLHTLKGGARMAGITAIGNLSHSLETTIDAVVDGLVQRSPEMIDLLQLSHDRLVTMLEQVRNHEPIIQGDDLIHRVEALASGEPAVVEEPQAEPPSVAATHHETVSAMPIAETVASESTGLPDITPDLSSLEQAVAEVEYNLTAQIRDFNDRALFDNLYRSGIKLARTSREIGIRELVEVTDALMALLGAINDGHVPTSKISADLMMLALDRLRLMIGQVLMLEPVESSQFIAVDIHDLINNSVVVEEGGAAKSVAPEKESTEIEIPENLEDGDNRRRAPRIQHEVVRVRADLLDNLVNFAGEVSIYRSRVEQQIGSFRGSIDEMDQTVERLQDQIRQVNIETEAQIASRQEEVQKLGYEDFDPLEFDRFTHMQQLSRSMMESLSDLVSIEEMLLNLTRESETLLLQQSRVNTELQENLMHTRMVPLAEYAPRLRRIVRQTSSELGKRTNLSFEGAEVEMDRNVVERMMAPLEHMLRNSIAHGIEDKGTRLQAGKDEAGNITITLSREGSEIIVRVHDDGAGINLEAVKKKALERGLMKEGSKLSDKEIVSFILESGFSTAKELSQISGRGVGMDVVNSEIKQLGGMLEIDSVPGKGTEFTIRLPLTLSVSRALLVNVAEDIYAIPLLSIYGIERIAGTELESLLGSDNPTFNWLGEEYDLMHLTNVLGAGSGQISSESAKVPMLLARSGEHRIAFAIDGLIGSREIVVKSLGPQLSTLQDLAGATILADGSVALIIDMPSLIRRGLARKGGELAEVEVAAVTEVREPIVMVVDDSITVRKVTERLLKRHNMKCVTAKDGVDALTVLEETIPDVMLLDIEMPRMDGFELATHIRNSEVLKDIPIIMITSRTGDKHRQRAMDIGVNKYMGKPYTEVDLLENIESLIGKQD